MKATHQHINTGVKHCFVAVKFAVTQTSIERAIAHEIEMRPENKVTKKSMRSALDFLLYSSGESMDSHDYDFKNPELKRIGKKLFPSFYD